MNSLEAQIKERAKAIGFGLSGIARATEADGFARLEEWLARGYAGEVNYLHRHGEARQQPHNVRAEVRSVIMVAFDYGIFEPNDIPPPKPTQKVNSPRSNTGRVARYARGRDYHDEIRERLNQLLSWIQ